MHDKFRKSYVITLTDEYDEMEGDEDEEQDTEKKMKKMSKYQNKVIDMLKIVSKQSTASRNDSRRGRLGKIYNGKDIY